MIADDRDAFLVPVPQYPLYSAALTLYGGTLIPYYLDEERAWGIDVDGVEQLIADARGRGMRVRGMVVINPGNPTGQVLTLENQVRSVSLPAFRPSPPPISLSLGVAALWLFVCLCRVLLPPWHCRCAT